MDEKDYTKTNPRASYYACFFPKLREIAIEHGYNLAIHGSMARDLDLIAVPWLDEVKDHEVMVDKMLQAIGGSIQGAMLPVPGEKPHGRIVYTLSIFADWFIDLSIMAPAGRSFKLSPDQAKAFKESESKRLMFEFGGGIGYKIMYEGKTGKWFDITD